MRTLGAWGAALWLLLGGCGPAPQEAPAPEGERPEIPLLEDLGSHGMPIGTKSAEAQRYFDQGLVLTYGFNHDAAVRSFREASRRDPGCAMCYWGIAYALGPNINAPMGPEAGREAYAAVQKALALDAGERERAYIEALATRYSAEPGADRGALDRAYADAMRALSRRHPDDLDAATLFAEALMDLQPWQHWARDGQPAEHTLEIVATLEGVLGRNPRHPGANHYYIHAVEQSRQPERAVAAADRLLELVPGAGHLTHMPSHIYWRVGRYEDAVRTNQSAIGVDESYFTYCRRAGLYGAGYYPHNIHFLWAAAAEQGQSALALAEARNLASKIEAQLEAFPFVEEYRVVPMLTLVRFGRWDQVWAEPEPPERLRYSRGIWHYARGLAYVRHGQPDRAEGELLELENVRSEPAVADLMLSGGVNSAATLLEIGARQLAGEIAAARGDYEAAIAALRAAVGVQDGLNYMEPPPWYFPVRHALGAVLLEAGRPQEAEATYRKSLENYPRNGWALYGLARSLREQQRDDDAVLVAQGFQNAWARADVELAASRF